MCVQVDVIQMCMLLLVSRYTIQVMYNAKSKLLCYGLSRETRQSYDVLNLFFMQ